MLDFFKYRVGQSAWTKLIGRTLMKWQQDDCLEMGAALAYYALFSMFPMILVSLSVVGFLIGPNTVAYNAVLIFAQETLPPDAFPIVQTTLIQFHTGSTSASIVGFCILLFTSSGFFGALSRSFDKIWHTKPRHHRFDGVGEVAFIFLWRRFLAFLLVMGATSLIFVSLLSNIAIDTVTKILEGVNQWVTVIGIDQVQLLSWLRLGISFVTLTLVVMVLYKTLPSTRVSWRDVWLGALLTAMLWLVLQQLISNSVISLGSQFRSYGVVGGVMVLMLWIYLTSQIFFLGGEFTYVYAHLFGSRKGQKKLMTKVGSQ
ncbi:YihY/virulence factor BrkB family protein [Nodosilinea sp. LEGE 06152]|uniref:YihY/virulence factor BrkB family protein n=1 Tax=Nodosilinea sp. LEGE 06152 TaxID=2777966 RepID=UPI00188146CE|nr:YihY/virulence factor BrkB family protein [Nodosilinea sp. LEGE 06152]MBE9155822.1 YihY/virulence factor BrkB family protein [Nodosilinea sp. LEGE 06152]